jgi:hypothetical protein
MAKTDRERRHRAVLEHIDEVLLVTGCGDRTRIDHEGTLLERARMLGADVCSHAATERGLAALDRLLRRLEEPDHRHGLDVARFVDAVWRHQPLPLGTLRALDAETGDDMLAVLDAYRHARLDLVEQVEGGPRRVHRAMGAWGHAGA